MEGKGAALIMPACNTEAMNLHLVEIAKVVTPGAHAMLLVDQAGWHMSTHLTVPPNITIITLPSKSPELNPVENVWQGNRVKERMLNPIGKFFAPWGVLDSHRAKFWSATQSEGFMLCVPSGLRNAADSAKTVHPIALKRLAVHARRLALKPSVQILRRSRRPLLRGLEQAH